MYHGTKKRIAKSSAESTFSSIRFGEASWSSLPFSNKRSDFHRETWTALTRAAASITQPLKQPWK
jgi:hypothetical protein